MSRETFRQTRYEITLAYDEFLVLVSNVNVNKKPKLKPKPNKNQSQNEPNQTNVNFIDIAKRRVTLE